MRKILIVLIVSLLMFGLVSVGLANDVKLSFWTWRPEDKTAYEAIIAEFNKENPDIEIEYVPYKNTEYNTILSTALQGGSGPDIMMLRSYGGMEPLANAGYLLSLDDKIAELDSFSSDVLGGMRNRRDDKIYGVASATQNIQILYNKKIFKELGIEKPNTWGELLEIAKIAKNAGYIPFANGTKDAWTNETLFGGIAPTFYGGTDLYDKLVKGETNFEDGKLKYALEKMLELRPYLPDSYVGVGYSDMQVMFAQEMAAMFVAGSYELGTMAQMNPNLEIGAFIVPGETNDVPSYNSIYVDGGYGVNAASKHVEEALKFVKFTASKEYGEMYTAKLKQISAVPEVQATDPTLNEIIKIAKPTPYLMLTAFRYGSPSGSTLLQNELQALFAGDQDIKTSLRNIQIGIETWYEPFQK